MLEQNINTDDQSLFDLVMSENVNFVSIDDGVLETAMSTMTQSMGK